MARTYEDGPPPGLPLPSDRSVTAARERSQQALEDVRRAVNAVWQELVNVEVYAREAASARTTSGAFEQPPEARTAYRDMADRIKAIRGES